MDKVLNTVAIKYTPSPFQKLHGIKTFVFYGNGVFKDVFVEHRLGKIFPVSKLNANFYSIGYNVIHLCKGDKEKLGNGTTLYYCFPVKKTN